MTSLRLVKLNDLHIELLQRVDICSYIDTALIIMLTFDLQQYTRISEFTYH